MEFRVLGPLEAWHGDAAVRVPGRIGVRLLALLLMDPGRIVPMHRLIEGIWDGEPPATAAAQVRNAASRLRGDLGDDLVEFAAGGYRIDTMKTTVDAEAFDDLVRRARNLIATDDRPGALSALDSALSLWRGNAFEGLHGRVIEAGAAHLDETRMTAIEERIDLEIELREPERVVGELKQLVSEHPYRQRLTSRLMLALHHAGRTPEALEVYEALRLRLAEDLGIDPDSQLKQLHTALLRGDVPRPRQAAQPPVPREDPGPVVPVPAQLPARPATFVGRADDLDSLTHRLDDPDLARSCVVAGAAGTGKTALSVHWAHRVRDRFPDGQLFVNLRGFDADGPLDPRQALAGFLRALRPGETVPSSVEEATALYRSQTQNRRLLVILDNARDAAQVRPLLPSGEHCFAVVTSRHKLAGLSAIDGTGHVGLGALPRKESMNLIAAAIGSRRADHDRESVNRISQLCGDLPLALRIAAAHLSTHPALSAHDYAAELDSSDRLDVLTIDGDPDATVKTALDRSFRLLDPESADLFCRLGLLPGVDVPTDLAVAVSRSPQTATRLLGRLESAHLLEQHRPNRYRFHDLVREYGKERASRCLEPTDRQDVVSRVIDWYHRRRFDRLVDNYDNLIAAIEAWPQHPSLWKLLFALNCLAASGLDSSPLKHHLDPAMARAVALDDVPAQQALYQCIAQRKAGSGDFAGDLEYSAKAATIGPDPTGYHTFCMAGAHYNLGHSEAAEVAATQARRLAQVSGNEYVLVSSGRLLGWIHTGAGRFADARAALTQALADCSTESCRMVQMSLARIHVYTGETAAARDIVESMLGRPGELSLASHRAVMVLRSDIHIQEGAHDAALDDLAVALRLDERQGGRAQLVADTQLRIADVWGRKGDFTTALAHFNAVAGGRPTPVRTRGFYELIRARIHNGLRDFSVAVEAATRAKDIFAAIPMPLRQAGAMVALAQAYDGLGQPRRAADIRREALEIFSKLGALEAEEVRASLR